MRLMRQKHNELGLNADLALAWHESGHAVTACALGRLLRVQIKSGPRTYLRRAGINPDDNMCIAAMGPAAQLAYMARHRKKEPSSWFLDKWVYHAARKDPEKLSQRWARMPSSVDEWRTRIQRLSRFIRKIPRFLML